MSSNTNIGNTPVNQGYVQLIHMGETGGIDGTLRALYDGDGTASDLLIASDKVKISTTLYIGSDTLAEYIQDTVGTMFTGNTETNITVTYQDTDGTIDLVSTGEVTLIGSQTLTNKTLTAPVLTGVTQGADITLSGDLTVNGTTVTVDQTNLDVSDNIIGLNRGASSNANDSGLIIERGSTGDNAAIIWDESANKFTLGTTTSTPSATGDLTISTGTLVANLEGAVTGNASTATALASAGTLTFTGDVVGSSTPTYTGGGNLSIAMAIQANSIALGTDTTGNYMAQVSAGTGVSISHTQSEGSTATISSNDSAIVHDNLSGFVANEHIDWTTDQGVTNIHAGNYTDTNTNQLTTFNVTGDSGTPESIAQGNTLDIAGGTGIATVVSATDTVTVNLSHLGLEDLADPNDDRILFWDESVGAGKLQWLDIGSNISISGSTISATNTTYASDDFDHDALINFVANEHIDWTGASAGTIHASNYTDTVTTIDGTTANGVLTYGGTNNIDTESTLTFDGSTLALTGALTSTGNITTNGEIYLDNGGDAIAFMGVSDANYRKALYASNDDHYVTNRHTSGDLILMSNNGSAGGETEAIRIKHTTQNVGIGTASPGSKLHIAASGSYSAPTGGLDGNINLLINNTQYSGIQILGRNDGSSFIHFGDQNDANVGVITYEHSGDYMAFRTNATEAMRFDNSQNTIIPATSKLYLDGGGDTYIHEDADDRLRFFTGGDEFMRFTQQDAGGEIFSIYQDVYIPDDKKIHFGGGNDLKIYHDGSNNYIESATSDQDLFIRVNDGGSTINAIYIDASEVGRVKLPNDGQRLVFGASDDLHIEHSTHSYISNNTGDFIIQTQGTDSDMIFKSDDGSGGLAAYLTLNGGSVITRVHKIMRFDDSIDLRLGAGSDLRLYHTGSHSYIENYTGDLYIRNTLDDKDVILQSDDGSGGTTAYLTLDGSATITTVHKNMKFDDSVYLYLGTDSDFNLLHNNTNAYIENGTGDLYIRNNANDKDVILQSDDGSGGTTAYLTLDGSTTDLLLSPPGNVGIGTSSLGTNYKMIVKRTTNCNLGVGLQGGELSLEAFNDAITASVPFRLYGSEFNMLGGNVGIGTEAPNANLSLGAVTGAKRFLVYDGGSSNNLYAGFGIDSPASNDFSMYTHNNGALKFGKMGTDASTITPYMTITNAGNVGIGTTSPDERLSVVSGSTSRTAHFGRYEDNGLFLHSEAAANDTHYNWMIQTQENIDGGLEIHPSASVGGYDWVSAGGIAIKRTGEVGIGTNSPGYKLDVAGDARILSGSLGVGVAPNATDGRGDFSNDVVSYSTSDKRLKENIKPLDNALDKVLKISGVSFDWKELTEKEKKTIHGNTGHDVGVIAQEIEAILPEVVTTRDNGYKAVKYEKIVPLLIEAIKEQQVEIDCLKANYDQLKYNRR